MCELFSSLQDVMNLYMYGYKNAYVHAHAYMQTNTNSQMWARIIGLSV